MHPVSRHQWTERSPIPEPVIKISSSGAWQALPDNGIRSAAGIGVQAMAFVSDTLYVGRPFTETAGGSVQYLGNIAALGVPPLASFPLYLPLVTR